jgi:hypothetical protein
MITQLEGKKKREIKMEKKSNPHSHMVYAIFANP